MLIGKLAPISQQFSKRRLRNGPVAGAMVLTPSHFQGPQNSHHRVLKSRLQKPDIQTGFNLDSTFKSMVTGRLLSTLGAAVASTNTSRARHLVEGEQRDKKGRGMFVRTEIDFREDKDQGWLELFLEGGR